MIRWRPTGALLLALAVGAGLLTGLSRFGDPVICTVTLLLAGWILRYQPWWPAFPAAALGILVGLHAIATMQTSCPAVLPNGPVELTVRLVDPAPGSGRVILPATRCSGTVMVRWPRGALFPAGAGLSVRGRWFKRTGLFGRVDGQLLVERAEPVAATSSASVTLPDHLRTYLARASTRLYGKRAPLVDALVTGRRGELDPELKAAFAASGLMHLLAISGFHIGLLAAWVLLALKLCGVSRHRAEAGAALMATGYAAFLGWPAPATRAALLIVIYTWCRWRQRNPRISTMVGCSVLPLLLVSPWAITEPGAWLSVLALAGLTAATRWSDRAIGEHDLIRVISASVGATVATAPLTALVFGQVAPIAILLSVFAGPLASLIQPAIMASLALAGLAPFLAGAFAASSGVLLQALEVLVRFGSTAPGSGAALTPGLKAAIPWLLLLAAFAWSISGRSTLRVAGYRSACAGTAGLWLALLAGGELRHPPEVGELGLFFLDVGQGDAALIRTPGGHWLEVDAGPASDRYNAGSKVILPFLREMNVRRLDLFVASHAHRDHIGGASAIIDKIPIGVVVEPAEPFLDEGYLGWLDHIVDHQIRWRRGEPGLSWTVDGVAFRILHPPVSWRHRGEDLNEDSIVLEVRYGSFTALFAGDAGFVAESLYSTSVGRVDILKVGHHGSRGATGEELLAHTSPRVAIVSVGENNYGHPSTEALARLMHAGAEVVRTDREGNIAVRTDGRTVTVRGNRYASTFAAGSAPGR